jgi:ABC-type proline/glycine betaine transport system permease subunit
MLQVSPKRVVATGRRPKRSKREPIFTPLGTLYLMALTFAAGVGIGFYWAIASFSTILILLGVIAIVTLALVFNRMKDLSWLRLPGGAKRSRNGARRAI